MLIHLKIVFLLIFFFAGDTNAQKSKPLFRIRTITAGITVKDLNDTTTIKNAISFLKKAEKVYLKEGYEVQTLRIATQNFHSYLNNSTYQQAIPHLIVFDKIAKAHNISFSIGQIIKGDEFVEDIDDWAVKLLHKTSSISFSVPVSSHALGVHSNAIIASAKIIKAISQNTEGGEGNFRFTASANCPAGIPFFPAAFHEGINSFAIGLESPNLLKSIIENSDSITKQQLKTSLEKAFMPVQVLAKKISSDNNWKYNGIDLSPAPGLDASIGAVIEAYTKFPFGSASTLAACSFITDVLKSLNLQKCGYSGLMLPVIEDKVLAQRAGEERFTVQELLLYSSVSGTGLDVVPLAGNTSLQAIEGILTDVAALSLKYSDKALSVRLFLLPGKKAGDIVEFNNPYLTKSIVMKLE